MIKLLTLWMLDDDKNAWYPKPNDHVITHGIWETGGVEITDDDKVYTMILRMPGHTSQNAGDVIKMKEWMLIELCHQVKIVSEPKLASMIKRLTHKD